MLPQTPVFFMNANATAHPPTPPEPKKKKKLEKENSSTQYIDNIMLNSFQLKLLKFTKNEQNKNKKPLQAHHVTTKNRTEETTIKIPNKNSASTPCRVQHTLFMLSSIVSSPIDDGQFKSKESQSYIIMNTIAQSQFHTQIKTKYRRFL